MAAISNRFLVANECMLEKQKTPTPGPQGVQSDSTIKGEVYALIGSVLAGGDEPTSFTRIVSRSVADVLFSWIARLLLIMEKLPLIVEDVSVVFANLFDLYFTTVFR